MGIHNLSHHLKRAFYRRSRRGKVIRVVQEKYLHSFASNETATNLEDFFAESSDSSDDIDIFGYVCGSEMTLVGRICS